MKKGKIQIGVGKLLLIISIILIMVVVIALFCEKNNDNNVVHLLSTSIKEKANYTETVGSYNITYEYSSNYEQCNVTIRNNDSTFYSIPSGWGASEGAMTQIKAISKTFYQNTTENLSEHLNSQVIIRVDKIVVPVTGIRIDDEQGQMLTMGDIHQLTATIEPENATNQNVTWTSSDSQTATVDNKGVIRVKGGGKIVTITARSEDGGYEATWEFTARYNQYHISETGVTLDRTSLTLDKGTTMPFGIVATVEPENATKKNVTWTSSNPKVATVDENGVVTAVAGGTATITATTEIEQKQAHCQVIVRDNVEKVELNKQTTTIEVGKTEALKATITPTNAVNTNVSWTSTNEEVATVDENGMVTAHTEGASTITVRTENGNKMANCVVNVTKPNAYNKYTETDTQVAYNILYEYMDTTGNNQYDMCKVTIANISSGVIPSGWTKIETENNPSYGEISVHKYYKSNGKETVAIARDNITITVDKIAIPVTGIRIDEPTQMLTMGNTHHLTAIIEPENATNKNVTWISSDSQIATVDNEGVIRVKGGGKIVTITARSEDGGYEATWEFTARYNQHYISETGVTLDKTSLTLEQGTTMPFGIVATVEPENATNKDVTWTSSNPKVATVDENGVVTAVAGGTATITATTEIEQKQAHCQVTVNELVVPVTGITLNKSEINMWKDTTQRLTATIEPENATNKGVTWTSSNPEIATVDENGVVTAHNIGVTTITVRTEEGNKTATSVVNVDYHYYYHKEEQDDTQEGCEIIYDYMDTTNDKRYDVCKVTVRLTGTKYGTFLYEYSGWMKVSDTELRTYFSDNKETMLGNVNGVDDIYINVERIGEHVVSVTGITLDKSEINMWKNTTQRLTATIEPENATNKEVIWTSSNPEVATVNANGLITAKEEGETTITVMAIENQEKKATCKIIVKQKETGNKQLEEIQVVKKPIKTEYKIGEELDLSGLEVVANYKDGSTQKITNYITNPKEGTQLLEEGEIVVKVQYEEKEDEFTVTVSKKQEGNNNQSGNGNKTSSSTNTINKTISPKQLPKAGLSEELIIAIVIISVIGIGGYIKYRKIHNI